jgi:hypothetical protein
VTDDQIKEQWTKTIQRNRRGCIDVKIKIITLSRKRPLTSAKLSNKTDRK